MVLELLIIGTMSLLAWQVYKALDDNSERLIQILGIIRDLNNRVSEIEKQIDDQQKKD